MTTRRHAYTRSATTSVSQLLSDNDVVRTCTSLIQRLTTRVRGPSMSSCSSTTNPALVSSAAVAAVAISNMGTERARLESKYADMLERSRKHAATSPPPPRRRDDGSKRDSLVLTEKAYPYVARKDPATYRRDAVILSEKQYPYVKAESVRVSNSRDKTPYRMLEYTKPTPGVAPGKYQYRTRQRSSTNLTPSASSTSIFTSSKSTTRSSPPSLSISASSKRRQFASASRQNQSEQVDPVALSRSKLVLSNYEEHLNTASKGIIPEKIAKTKFDDPATELYSRKQPSVSYFSKTLDDTKTKEKSILKSTDLFRQKSEVVKNSFKNLSTSKSCHNFAAASKQQHPVINKLETMDTRDSSTLEREEPPPPKRKDIDALLLKYSIIDDAYSGKVNLSNVAPLNVINTGATYVSKYVAPAPVVPKSARSAAPFDPQPFQSLQSFKPAPRFGLRNYRVSNFNILTRFSREIMQPIVQTCVL